MGDPAVPLNVTAPGLDPKLVPVMVTLAPTIQEFGDKLVIFAAANAGLAASRIAKSGRIRLAKQSGSICKLVSLADGRNAFSSVPLLFPLCKQPFVYKIVNCSRSAADEAYSWRSPLPLQGFRTWCQSVRTDDPSQGESQGQTARVSKMQ